MLGQCAGKAAVSSKSALAGSVRLLLELLTIPLFITALQLPQAVLVYWSTSSSMALAQASLNLHMRVSFCELVKYCEEVMPHCHMDKVYVWRRIKY